ncbi:MAG: helix-turn-helix transcriptional regulator [Planctomycetes bacterium]|nr:helix-turn-helix transcriptional regulator [Planctomycetota bacterium]
MSKKPADRAPDGLWGSRVASCRAAKGWNQTELAFHANMSAAEISRFENGAREPRVSGLVRLARALGVSADYLLGLSDDPAPRGKG